MKIRTRLYLSAGASIVLVVVLFCIVLITSIRIDRENENNILMTDVNTGIEELNRVTQDYLLLRDMELEQEWHTKYNSLGEILDTFSEEGMITPIRSDYNALGNLFSAITSNGENIDWLRENGASQDEINFVSEQEKMNISQLYVTSHSLITDAIVSAEETQDNVISAQRLASNLTLILASALALTLTGSSILIARSITRPLDILIKGAGIVGTGNLNHKVEIETGDELGSLAASFNKMTENLKETTTTRDLLNSEVTMRSQIQEELLKSHNELKAVNKELESFSYSVSHDLRAPLRSIDGFSLALLEDYQGKMDGQGEHYLNRIRAASQHMGQLIDDLLSLSRLTRGQMNFETVDLTGLAQSIAESLKAAEPERSVEFVIQEGLSAEADPRFMKILLENLLGNAWKFTSKHTEALIEFGIAPYDGKPVYYVRDDGAGFDAAYADKLFGAFQRVHTASEFPGTGIGLATVKRVIHRHGGAVWAEGEVEKGATFYFSF